MNARENLPTIDEELRQVIANPELNEICVDVLVGVAQITSEIATLASLPEVNKQTVVTQEAVDGLVAEIVGDELLPGVFKSSGLLSQLEKEMPKPDFPGQTKLRKALATILFANGEPMNRSISRDAVGPNMHQTKQMMGFLRATGFAPTVEQLRSIREKIIDPINEAIERSTLSSQPDTSSNTDRLGGVLAAYSEIDPSTNLADVKFVAFSAMVAACESPLIVEQFLKAEGLQEPGVGEKIRESDLGGAYLASDLLTDMLEGTGRLRRGLDTLMERHQKGRTFRVATRQFREDHHKLSVAAATYNNLLKIEEALGAIDTRESELVDSYRQSLKVDANLLVARSVTLLTETQFSAFQIHDRRTHEAEDSLEAIEAVWEDTLAAEDVRISNARLILDQIDELGLEIDPATHQRLEGVCEPTAKIHRDDLYLRAELEMLKPAIDERIAEFHAIDDSYSMPNRRLRERDPELITLSKLVADSIVDRRFIDDDTSRSLIGLMRGIYWERTAMKATNESLAESYIADVERLRKLSEDLEYFGQPQESRLIKLIDLLDELIDSGVFDDTEDYPVLEQFDDFLLEYMIARDNVLATAV